MTTESWNAQAARQAGEQREAAAEKLAAALARSAQEALAAAGDQSPICLQLMICCQTWPWCG